MKPEPDAARWTLKEIDWPSIERERSRADPLIYFVVAPASFIESGADLYTGALADHVTDPAARNWLREAWQPEELQHGQALRRYVEVVWPELDWQRGYAGFMAEYSPLCAEQALNPSPALEMVARCAVEVGTSALYTTLQRYAPDPVLRDLARRIRQDEVRHFSHFRRYYEAGRDAEKIGRLDVLRTLLARLTESESLDAAIAFKHAWMLRNPGGTYSDRLFDAHKIRVRPVMRRYFPYRMAVKMLLSPLRLNATLDGLSAPLLEQWARWRMF